MIYMSLNGFKKLAMAWLSLNMALLMTILKILEASDCTEKQISSCKSAAASGNISESPGGGVCQSKSYVHFTHLCTVTNYVPSINHCCCAQAERVFCCRYHYDWNYFRCVEADDTVYRRSSDAWPQEIFWTAILVPTIFGLCCVICCFRHFCCHCDDEDDRFGCSKCLCVCKKKKTDISNQGKPHYFPSRKSQSQAEKPSLPADSRYIHHMTGGGSHAQYSSVPCAPLLEDPAAVHRLSEIVSYSTGGHLLYKNKAPTNVLDLIRSEAGLSRNPAQSLDNKLTSFSRAIIASPEPYSPKEFQSDNNPFVTGNTFN